MARTPTELGAEKRGPAAAGAPGGAWPHLLRALAMALAALALAWGIAGTEALVAVMLCAGGGVALGEVLARSRVRLAVIVGASVAALLLVWLGASVATATEAVPRFLGAAATVRVSAVLRFGVLALAATVALRAVAARRRTAVALELGLCAIAVAAVFASHRDGVIARPLWLSDWAWQQGIDPTHVLLGVGCAAVGMLAVLLLVETRSGRGVSSIVVLAALASLALLCVSVVGVPKPDPMSDLGIETKGDGEPPPPPPPDAGPGQRGDAGDDAGDGGGRDAGADASDQGNLDGGGSDGGIDGGGGPDDAGADAAEVAERPNERPRDSSQEQLDQSEGQRGAAAPVAVVIFEDDYSPPAQAYYFREDALSQFNGARLVAASRGDVDTNIVLSHPTEPAKVRGAPEAAGRVRVRARVAMLTEHSRPFGLESPVEFAPIPNPNRQRFVRAYRFEALAQSLEYKKLFGKLGGDPAWSPEVLAYYTHAPADPRYTELAKQLVAKLPPVRQADPFAKALAVKIHLDRELTYSTKARHAGATDPTAEMLFGDKIGYCVHFAHAAAYLWRSVGVPARVGVGYRTEEDVRQGGSTVLVRSGEAHAWPELYLNGIGWVILDIAAARNLDPPNPPPDDDLQRLLGEMAREQPPNPKEPPKTRRAARGNFGRDIGIAGLLLVALANAVLYLIKAWRRIVPVLAGPRTMPRVGYRYALDLLAEAGWSREFGETREAFARRVQALAPSFERVTEMHLAAHFRSTDLDPKQRPEMSRAAWKEALRGLRADVSRRGKLLRRILGLLNPASIFDAR